MKFLKANNDMVIKTTKGDLTIEKNEYLVIESERGTRPLMINKEGVQKITKFFKAKSTKPEIQQVWNSNQNFNIIATVEFIVDGESFYATASANILNLQQDISKAYAAEMAVKRAKSTASLEILRENYTGKEPLPLLYSSFDEFNTEESINNGIKVEDASSVGNKSEGKGSKAAETKTKETQKPVENKVDENNKPVEETQNVDENKPAVEEKSKAEKTNKVEETQNPDEQVEEIKNETDTTDAGSEVDQLAKFMIDTNKYRSGISLADLAEKDEKYFKWLANAENVRGKYEEYQRNVRKYAEMMNIDITA